MMWITFIHSPLTHAAITGILTAGAVDFQAFKHFQSFQDAATYGWGKAAFRWAQGAIIGVVSAAGFGAILG